MWLDALMERLDEPGTLALGALFIGMTFGFMAQRSRFCLRGFGGMLADGCAVGASISGAAVFTLTAWVTLLAMWAGATVTDRLIDQHPADTRTEPTVPQAPLSRA